MTDDQVLQMVPEVLRAIQKGIAELKDAQVATRMEISALGQQVAGLTTAVYAGHDRFTVLEQRIERDLADIKADVRLMKWMLGFLLALGAANLGLLIRLGLGGAGG